MSLRDEAAIVGIGQLHFTGASGSTEPRRNVIVNDFFAAP